MLKSNTLLSWAEREGVFTGMFIVPTDLKLFNKLLIFEIKKAEYLMFERLYMYIPSTPAVCTAPFATYTF